MYSAILLLCLLHLATSQCPSGWTQDYVNKKKCLKGFRNETTWLGALTMCQELAEDGTGSLLSIHNAFENTQAATIGQQTFEACLYWIGLDDFDESGAYSWIDGSTIDYLNWATGYPPKNPEGTAAYLSLQDRNRWMATQDIAETNCFICQQGVGEPAPVRKGCPEGWEPYWGTENKCIKGFKDEINWLGAYEYCQNHGSDLVSIHSPFQNLHVSTVAQGTFEACLYWIGLADMDGTQYGWMDGTPLDYTKWATGYPPVDPVGTTGYLNLQDHQRWMTTGDIAETNCYVCEMTLN